MKPIFFIRNPSIHFRFILTVLIAICIICIDSHLNEFKKIRVYMDTIISPFYFALNTSFDLLDSFFRMISTHNQLEIENKILRKELFLKESELLILDQYKQENAHLRKLLGSPLRQNEQKRMITQVISTINDLYNHQVVIDKGSLHGVYEGQPIVNEKGIVGQVISVSKLTSRVLLICDPTHALPIQVLRNDLRVIAIGNGFSNDLHLQYLPINIDICVGDMLVASGLGNRFPEGYPVAVVSSVQLNTKSAHTVIQAHPTADLHHLHYLLLIWKKDHKKAHSTMTPNEVHRIANERLMTTSLP